MFDCSKVLRSLEYQGAYYVVRELAWADQSRHKAYQRLRAETFVKRMGWSIPLVDGREYDTHDLQASSHVRTFGVFGGEPQGEEWFLGGVRIFELPDWHASMVANEFYDAGMIPERVLDRLYQRYECSCLLELTRLCIQRGKYFSTPTTEYDLAIVRDLVYAAAYSFSQRPYALGIADARYLPIMKRSHFVYDTLYTESRTPTASYALTVVDLPATIASIQARDPKQAERMLALNPVIVPISH